MTLVHPGNNNGLNRLEKSAMGGPNVTSYRGNYDKFQMKAAPLSVPNYKMADPNKWQNTYSRMQKNSHPDFKPIYGPQGNKRPINDMLDIYKKKKDGDDQRNDERPKKPAQESPKRGKETKEKKPATPKKEREKPMKVEDVYDDYDSPKREAPMREDTTPKHIADKPPKVDKEKQPRVPNEQPQKKPDMDVYKDTKENDKKTDKDKTKDTKEQKPIRKEDEVTPREERKRYTADRSPKKTESPKSTNRLEDNAPTESPRKKYDDNEDKYYGYEERPVRHDEKEPVNKEVKFTPIVEKRDNKNQVKDKKKDEKENKKDNKETPKEKKDPYDEWVREKNKVNDRKQDPHETPKRQKEDPYSYRPRDDPKESTQRQTPRVQPHKDGPRKDTSDRKPEQSRRDVPYVRDRETKPRWDDNLYTSRDHMRPTKSQNNNTSIVRDGGNPKLDRRNKPTAKVHPTARDWDGEKWDTKGRDKPARARFYQNADMDDVLQDKIATELRDNGIAETKVVPLSAKITQAVRDDVIDTNQNLSPQVTSNLTEVIHKHLDPILYSKANVTDLRDSQKASDAQHLSSLVLMRIGQVHEEIELCKLSVDDHRGGKKGKATTPRDELHDRSMLMTIKGGIEKQKAEKEILQDKLHQAQVDTQEVEDAIHKRQGQLQNLDTDNWNLQQGLNDAEQTKQGLVSKLKEQEKECYQLDKQNQEIRQENLKLRSRVNEIEGQNHNLSSELTKLQSENAKLKVLTNQREKEILHLRDPDKDMVHKIRILSDEVTMLRTQSRRLNEEKALLKSRSQKMESSLDESNRQKGKLSVERENLLRENQELKQRYRKLALTNPQSRTLPDISTGRSGPSSYSTPRTNSRAPSRSIRHSNDRMSAALEDDEDDDYHR